MSFLRPEITVFEPLLATIPSNKAILPILWQLFPDNPYLLDTEFTFNPTFVAEWLCS